MIHILSDTSCDLSDDLLERFSIRIIPISVFIDGKSYLDRLELSLPQLFQLVETSKELPKTAAPGVGDFMSFFDSTAGENIYIGISSKLSSAVQNALLARQSVEGSHTRVIDSLNLSTGIGLLVLQAAEAAKRGDNLEEIERGITAAIPRVRTAFLVDTLEFLYRGGRTTVVENIVGRLLKIRPVIEVRKNGTLGVKEKIRGTRAKALHWILEDFQKNMANVDPHRIFITHTGCEEDAEFLRAEVQKLLPETEVGITTAGSVIASHCGPNTIGIIYLEK